jgi:hypothetical protein
MKERWEEKCAGSKDVVSAWILVLAMLVVMDVVLSHATTPF